MRAEQTARLFRNLRKGGAPAKVSQEAFDNDASHLWRLLSVQPGQLALPKDLWDYSQDLLYTEIQSDLFAYLLPLCLEAWRADLLGIASAYGGFVEYLYLSMARPGIFGEHLNAKQTSAVSEYMRDTILEEIDAQRGLRYSGAKSRPYRWVAAMTTFGVLIPEVNLLWERWWTLSTPGRAVSALQYLSCLMYGDKENPIFAPWTPTDGGGPPCLWEFAGHLYTQSWLEENVSFLKTVLTAENVREHVVKAASVLSKEPEAQNAAELVSDLSLCEDIIESRCRELPSFLATRQTPTSDFEWAR